jgi:hypothetical protein
VFTRRLIFSLAALTLFWLGWVMLKPAPSVPVAHAPGDGLQPLPGYRIIPLQPFSLTARVLAREDYHFDAGAKFSPTDLLLGWGVMADPQVISVIRFSQSNRFGFWQVDQFPVPRRDIETNSSNMHMIPANPAVAKTLADVREGERIALSGQLVRVEGDDGFRWVSSLSREDTGAGACELIWVEQLSRLD